MAELVLKTLTKVYTQAQSPAVDQLNLAVRDGEFIALLGPSGCGKSTTLRMVAGLESVTAGEIRIGKKLVNKLHPKDRGVGLAFENYALYPPLKVRDNLAFNLRAHGLGAKEINRRVEEIACTLQIQELLDLKPAALSSGQKQRVNMARAMVRRPSVLLLDEPLSHLDARLRVELRTEIKRLHAEQRFTTIIVTHDQLEAMALADRIAVMNEGKLQQFDTPLEVFNHPANEFVAGFLGEPPMNIFRAVVADSGRLVIPDTDFALPITPGVKKLIDSRKELKLGIRPWGIRVSQTQTDGSVPGKVAVVEDLGDETRVGVRYGEVLIMSSIPVTRRYRPGLQVFLRFNEEDLNLFDSITGERLSDGGYEANQTAPETAGKNEIQAPVSR
ncbi:MAG: ABC transporter ATP-binding protein [Verrucomicrobia bacterium]|nr:ABC transporter ATP-binding protein [Verrucomicrobiota bacterium]